jgi:peptidyl-tRNA hydrolase
MFNKVPETVCAVCFAPFFTFVTHAAIADVHLKERMALQVERHGPVLSSQIAHAKKQLDSLIISDARYQELLQTPANERTLADEVRVCMHEGLLHLKQENETLRLSAEVCHAKYSTELQEKGLLAANVNMSMRCKCTSGIFRL